MVSSISESAGNAVHIRFVVLYINLPKWSEHVESSFDLFRKADFKYHFVTVGKACVIKYSTKIYPVFRRQSYSNVYVISDYLQQKNIKNAHNKNKMEKIEKWQLQFPKNNFLRRKHFLF